MLRQINELVHFSFVYEELKQNYCLGNGRNAINPIRMFKYWLLKAIFELSDADVVQIRHVIQILPGHGTRRPVMDFSLLTKFRKLQLLDMLIKKTVEIAIEQEIIQSKAIIVDATHTKARYKQKSPREILQGRSRN